MRRGDYIDDLVGYVENNLRKGYREDQLRFLLINQGYSRSAVEKAFRLFYQKNPRAVPQVSVVEAPKIEAVYRHEAPPKKGFFARLFGMFSSDKKATAVKETAEVATPQSTQNVPDEVKIDSQGNLIK